MTRITVESTAVFVVERFVVSAPGEEPREFRSEREAEREARAAARRSGWADYYRVLGEPRTDLWRRPELLGGFMWHDEQSARVA